MCLILEILPGVSFPKDKLDVACENNKHGYGLAVPNEGRLTIHRSIKDNDPDEIHELLEKYKEKKRFLHLRWATVGDVSLQNNHPFMVLDKNDKSADVGFMHNGTLYDFKPDAKLGSKLSDSVVFKMEVVRPLALRLKGKSKKQTSIVEDKFFFKILEKYNSGMSVLLFFDGYGHSVKLNEKHGKEGEGWWASNEYSFRSAYRAPVQNYQNNWWARDGHETHQQSFLPAPSVPIIPKSIAQQDNERWLTPVQRSKARPSFEKWVDFITRPLIEKEVSPWDTTLLDDQLGIVKATVKNSVLNKDSIMHVNGPGSASYTTLASARKSFILQAGLSSLDELSKLTRPEVSDLIENAPVAMTELFIDLIAERCRKPNDRAALV